MRVVCDTNVLISGILFGGKPRDVLGFCSSGKLTNFTSPELLKEIEKVLLRPKFGLTEEQGYGIIRLFRETFSVVRPESRISVMTADPDDNRILETASTARAEAIISGDAHLLDLVEWNGNPVYNPENFLKKFFPA
ncbi:MAG: putative toxin-antitoxin system toxin component, PIN family [Chlorobiaceae bacterium]|nr:putative toxin-antitoxin system toxin component, PIN family [Chlorobiaceae bacterium]NTV60692.1 putative toxin-antitoxin system toxin component, PIN family [Chlorobiaceae bacterium]